MKALFQLMHYDDIYIINIIIIIKHTISTLVFLSFPEIGNRIVLVFSTTGFFCGRGEWCAIIILLCIITGVRVGDKQAERLSGSGARS
jgi:hypothetical protein